MKETIVGIASELEQLRTDQVRLKQNLYDVLELIDKAESRRKSEAENRSRWNRVLDNLEACMDEAKAKLGACESRIEHLERRRSAANVEPEPAQDVEARTPAVPEAPARRPEDAITDEELRILEEMGPVNEASFDAARRLLSIPLDEMGKLSLEEVALLHEQISHADADTFGADAGRIFGRLELANQVRSDGGGELDTSHERRRQILLRSAIDKILGGRVSEMTEAEIKVTLACHELFARRINMTKRDERLKTIINAGVHLIRRTKHPRPGAA
jgi:hypothetical protein